MKPKELFGLAVRLLGLFFLFLAVRSFASIFYASGRAVFSIILTTALYLAMSWWLVGGAKLLVQRAYPES